MVPTVVDAVDRLEAGRRGSAKRAGPAKPKRPPRKNENPPTSISGEAGTAEQSGPDDGPDTVAIVAVREERTAAGDDKTADSLQEEAPRAGGANWTAGGLLLVGLLLMVVVSTQRERLPGLLNTTQQPHVAVTDRRSGVVFEPQDAEQQTTGEAAATAKDDGIEGPRSGEPKALRIERGRVEQQEQPDEEEQRTQSDSKEGQEQRSQL